MKDTNYIWTDNPTVSGVSLCDTDVLNDCLMHLKYENNKGDAMPLFYNFYSKEDMTTTGAYVNASLGSWLSGNVYTTAYNELINKLGTDNIKSNADTYTDYDFVVNKDELTFRLPLLNGSECLGGEDVQTLSFSNPTSTKQTYTVPYNCYVTIIAYKSTTNNTMTVELNGNFVSQTRALTNGLSSESYFFAKKNDVISIYTDAVSTGWIIAQQKIVKATGVGNLYYKLANTALNLELLDVANITAELTSCYKRNTGDNSDLSVMSMPSNKFIDLTLGASGSTYTAPANGWVTYEGSGNNVVAWLHLLSGSEATVTSGGPSQSYANVYATIPVKKGDTFRLVYMTTTNYFRFIYAEGEV